MRLRRLEGEAIRDAMLAVSGRLDATLFGPPVPIHLTPFLDGRGRPAASGPLDGDGRRASTWPCGATFLTPMLLAFDTPIPFSTVGRRQVSNVPAQALILMNDPFVQQQAELWAKTVLARTEPPTRIGSRHVPDRVRPRRRRDDEIERVPGVRRGASGPARYDRRGRESRGPTWRTRCSTRKSSSTWIERCDRMPA